MPAKTGAPQYIARLQRQPRRGLASGGAGC